MKPILLLGVFFSAVLLTSCSPIEKTKNAFGSVKRGVTGGNKATSGSHAGAEGDREGKRVYLVIEANGMRRSTGYQVRHRSTYRGHPCIVLERFRTQILQRNKKRYKKTIRQRTITATDGAALYASTVILAGGERIEERCSISKGKATFEVIGPSGTQSSSIKVPRGIMFGIEPSWLVSQGLKVGKTYSAQVLDRSKKKIATERMVIQGHQREDVLGVETDVWAAISHREGATPVEMVFTASGDLVRLRAEDIVFRVVSKDEAKNEQAPIARIVSSVPVDFPLPAWDTYAELVYEVRPASGWRPYARNSDYTEVRNDGGRILLALRKKVLSPIRATLPMNTPSAMRPYLATARTILPEKRIIRETAKKILRGEKNVLRAVALLAGWVHQSVRFGSSDSLNPSPLSTLESRRGDCSEHADLFASLARSQGIPTRHCQDLIIQKEKAVYHTRIEAWLAGKWVPIDTTVNRVGLPAGYFLTAYGTGQGIPKDEFAWRMRRGDLTMHLLSATREYIGHNKHTMIPDQKRSFIAQEGQWLANLYWGFSLKLPKTWDGTIKLHSVEMTSKDPRRPAKVKCEAMEEEYQVRESTLDRIVKSLRKKFKHYKMIDARILPLETGPRIPGRQRGTSDAMMVDFSCMSGDTPLRCRQYIIPKRGRSYRIWIAAPDKTFMELMPDFRTILESFEL